MGSGWTHAGGRNLGRNGVREGGRGGAETKLELKRGRGDVELAGSSSSNAKMKRRESRPEDVLRAVVTIPTCTALMFVGVDLSREKLCIISDALRSSPTLKHLFFHYSFSTRGSIPERAAACRELLNAVRSDNKLQTLSVTESPGGLLFDAPQHLNDFLRNTTSLVHLELDFTGTFEDAIFGTYFQAVVDALVSSADMSSITLLSLSCSKFRTIRLVPKEFAIKLIGCSTLSDLSLERVQANSSPDFMAIMKSLENNHTLQRLSRIGCEFAFREWEGDRHQTLGAILDALSKSGFPQLDLGCTKFVNHANTEEQLAKNAASYAQALKAKTLILATAVRQFLCGDPHLDLSLCSPPQCRSSTEPKLVSAAAVGPLRVK